MGDEQRAHEQRAPVPSDGGLRDGVLARICNIASRPGLNGQFVLLESYAEEKGRWGVTLEQTGERMALKPSSLELVVGDAAVELNVELLDEEEPDWLSSQISDTLRSAASTAGAGAAAPETGSCARRARRRLLSWALRSPHLMEWAHEAHEGLAARVRTNMARFEPTHSMEDDCERGAGRAQALGLPSREQLRADAALAFALLQLHTECVRAVRRLSPDSLDSLGAGDSLAARVPDLFHNLLGCWHNRKHALCQLAEWHEVEGEYAAAEPLYEMLDSAARAAFRAGTCAPFAGDPNLRDPQHVAVALNNHALCHKRLGRYTRALPLYREAVGCYPQGGAPSFMCDNLAKCEALVNVPTRSSIGADYVSAVGDGAAIADDDVGAAACERIRQLGNDAFRCRRFDEAIKAYSLALRADDGAPPGERATPVERASILCNRAAAALGHSDFAAAAADAAAATELDAANAKAWMRLGTALQHTEGAEAALAALHRAVQCAPPWAQQARDLMTQISARASDGPRQLPFGAVNLSTTRFGDTTLGRLDRLVGTRGVRSLGAAGWVRAVYESAALWHGALRDCQAFRQMGTNVGADFAAGVPLGTSQALGDTGAGRIFFPVAAADVCRRLSDAICAVDEPTMTCPLLVWLEGRQYNMHQATHAINGLVEVLRATGAIFDFGMWDGCGGPHAEVAPAVSDEALVRLAKGLALSDDAVCEKLELTLRMYVIEHYHAMRLVQNTRDGITGAIIVPMLDVLERAMALRNLVVFNAHAALGGTPPPLVRTREEQLPPLRAWQCLFLANESGGAGLDAESDAIASVRASEAGRRLARMLAEPYVFVHYLQLARRSLRMPVAAFAPAALGGLETHDSLHLFASHCARTFVRTPRFFGTLAATIYDCASDGRSLESFDRPPTFGAAHRLYLHAAEIAEESTRGDASTDGVCDGHATHLPAYFLWEAANALCASNGDDGVGVEIDRVRALAARAEAAEESTCGLLGQRSPLQAMVAVRLVLDATRGRLGSQKLQRAEHKQLTKSVLEGTPDEICAALSEWSRRAGAKAPPVKVVGVPDTGPMWIPGAAPPTVADGDAP